MNKKFARLFKGVVVVVIPDLDAAGQKGANQTASRLKGVAASVKIARLPGELRETNGIDCRDVLAGPNGEQLVRQAIEDAAEWSSGKGQSGRRQAAPSAYLDRRVHDERFGGGRARRTTLRFSNAAGGLFVLLLVATTTTAKGSIGRRASRGSPKSRNRGCGRFSRGSATSPPNRPRAS